MRSMAVISSLCIFLSNLSLFLGHGDFDLQDSLPVCRNFQVSESTSTCTSAAQPYRTAFHFQPPSNWMNDPNGPTIYKGIYHLFYQYNPKGAVWSKNIVWGHSISTDLINWTLLDPAIYPSQPSDINGCWSGSTTILPGNEPVILYTGINSQNHQVQNLAIPTNHADPYLQKWTKLPTNPVMEPTQLNQINATSFRDPSTAWLGTDGRWRVIVGSERNRWGLAILYTSSDFVNWVQSENHLHSAEGTGIWECPDFFPVSWSSESGAIDGGEVKHVLKVSLFDTQKEYYTVGRYDVKRDVYVPDEGSVESDLGLRFDYGKFYASKSFFDGEKKRRVLWAWINESSSMDDDIKKGWSGIQGIPRTLRLHKSGKQLIQWPIREIEALRANPLHLPSKVLEGGSRLLVSGLSASQADAEVSFEVTEFEKAEMLDPSWSNPQIICSQKGASVKGSVGPFGLLVLASKGLEEYTAVFFRIFKGQSKYLVLMCSDQSRSSLNEDNDKTTYGAFVDIDPVHEKLSLRSLIDHSIVESFGGEGKACITARVYPTLAIDDDAYLYAFNYGNESVRMTEFNAWSMKKAQINQQKIVDKE